MSSTKKPDSYLSQQFMDRLSGCIATYHNTPQDTSIVDELRDLRSQLAHIWARADTRNLEGLYAGIPGKALGLFLASDFQDNPLSMEDENYSDELCQSIREEYQESAAIKYLIAVTLYYPAEKVPEEIFKIAIPAWFMENFAAYLLRPQIFFADKGDVSDYRRFINRAISYFYSRVYPRSKIEIPAPGSPEHKLASLFTHHMYTIPLYFGQSNLKDIMTKRAQLIEAALIKPDNHVDYLPVQHSDSHRRIRLGILCGHYNPQTETYATLPVYEYLDRRKYETFLYGTDLRGHALEHYCQSRADKLVDLPTDRSKQLQTIREDALDILFIGSNITAINSTISQLATYRLAPVQVTSICSPVTTGMKTVDYYISGDLTVSAQHDKAHYTEQLATISGSGLCFSFPGEDATPSIKPCRNQMGIPEDAVLYISGANFFKIIPELREAWLRIISDVPNSVLLLYPFNPYWSRSYKASLLFQDMQMLCEKYGIGMERMVILKPFQTRVDIKAFLEICDVYLDAFPYGGATSIIDPLQTGLPPVVLEGKYLRFRQASAILKELQMHELITKDEESYIELAIKLGNNRELRKRLRNEITEKMRQDPAFMDSRQYSEKIGILLEGMCLESTNRLKIT